jgi:hypothetical protein
MSARATVGILAVCLTVTMVALSKEVVELLIGKGADSRESRRQMLDPEIVKEREDVALRLKKLELEIAIEKDGLEVLKARVANRPVRHDFAGFGSDIQQDISDGDALHQQRESITKLEEEKEGLVIRLDSLNAKLGISGSSQDQHRQDR